MSLDALPPWLAAWWRGYDTGMSSKCIAAVCSGSSALWQVTEMAAPRDTSDVGRCVRLLDLAAANGCDWRACLDKLARSSPKWAALVPRWPEIEAAYHDDKAAQEAWNRAHPRHHRHMGGKSERARHHNAVRATFPPSRCWWLVATLQGHYDPYMDRVPHPFAQSATTGTSEAHRTASAPPSTATTPAPTPTTSHAALGSPTAPPPG